MGQVIVKRPDTSALLTRARLESDRGERDLFDDIWCKVLISSQQGQRAYRGKMTRAVAQEFADGGFAMTMFGANDYLLEW